MASSTKQATKNTITLKGSAQIVTEFFGYSINSILYQRGIYDPDNFTVVNKYGLRIWVTTDKDLQEYLQKVLGQLSEWLQTGTVRQLVLVIASLDDNETLERWVFNVDTDEEVVHHGKEVEKEEKTIMKEISAIIRQITASVTFLPLLEGPCSFDLLVYTKADADVPKQWEESDPKYISQSNEVRLRSFTTKVHKVETAVAYKAAEEDEI